MKKGLFTIGLFCLSTPIIADTLVGVLMSQDTENTIIDGRNFEGDGITSLIIAPKFSNSSLGGYFSVGGTFGRSEDERKTDEKNKEFKNNMSYRVFNLGLTYSPISNITFLGGAGYAQSEGKYYNDFHYDRHNRVEFNTAHTEKDRAINYNGGINFSYKNWGIITMYDSYPKVFSIGISYNYGAVTDNREEHKSNEQSSNNSQGLSIPEETIKGELIYKSSYGGEIRKYKDKILFYTNNHSYTNTNLYHDNKYDLALHKAVMEKYKILALEQNNSVFYSTSIYQLKAINKAINYRDMKDELKPIADALVISGILTLAKSYWLWNAGTQNE